MFTRRIRVLAYLLGSLVLILLASVLLANRAAPWPVTASLTPPASPAATSYTLDDIFTRLSTNAAATAGDHLFAPSGAPAETFHTLTEIYAAIPTIDGSKLLSGTTYLGIAGTIATQTLSNASTTVNAGYYAATTLDAVDGDLAAGNIKSGTTIFGVEGTYEAGGGGGGYPGSGWVPNGSGDGSTDLTQAACEAASGWYWFEDGNGDGDAADPEDGVCVQGTHQAAAGSWNGDDYASERDNTYIAAYTCSGNFPEGAVATYSGINSAGTEDATWNAGDCALCQADCYDGKKDLPDQGGYTTPVEDIAGHHGPITPEVLKNWKGTRLPTSNDFFGFCGYKDGYVAGDNYSTSCSADTTIGNYGQMAGRTDECIDLTNTGAWEWLSGQHANNDARIAGYYACSNFNSYNVYSDGRSRAVFRP